MSDIEKYNQGTVVREDFTSTEIQTTSETVATVLAARAKAEVEARFIVAMKRPRNWLDVRRQLLDACERPGFAGNATEKIWGAAWWQKPVGKSYIDGFSIRFAEEALRAMGNLDARSSVIWEDDRKRLVMVEVLDLENNISIPTTIVVEKTIERKFLKKGEKAISTRINSYGEPVHLREATADEVMQMQNSLVSKAMRNGILRLLPGDIQAECRDRILQIRHGDIAKDPKGFQKRVSDGFARHGVQPSDIDKYLGHSLESSSQAELGALRDLWKELDDGNTTWSDVMRAVAEERGEAPPDEEPPKKAMAKLTEKLQAQAEPQDEKPEPVTVPSDAFDAIKELHYFAHQAWGKEYEGPLSRACETSGYQLNTLTEEQAGNVLDVLTDINETDA